MRNARIVHGKASPVRHRGGGLFAGLPRPSRRGATTRSSSSARTLPDCLEITAWTAEGEIMGLRHRTLDVEGVQFHPESILTGEGKALLANWLGRLARRGGDGATP